MILDKEIIKHQAELFAYLLKQTGKDFELACDLYQDLFIKVRKTVANGKYVEEGKLLHWLKRIARNLVIDHYRKSSRMKLITPNDKADIFKMIGEEDEPYLDTFVTPEMSIKLKRAVSLLPDAQQELIDMRFNRNMSFKEIVIETGEKQANLLPRMHYAIKKLRKELCTN
jgi:RNA polymerase sigma-70 factor (ECF subfamily)